METQITVFKDPPHHFSVEEVFKTPFDMIHGFIERNYVKGPHSQGFYEINITLRGSALHKIGNSVFTVTQGDTFIIPPNVLHSYDGGEGFDVYHILIHPAYLERYTHDLRFLRAFTKLFHVDPMIKERASANPHFLLTNNELEELYPILEHLISTSQKRDAEHSIMANGEALVIIARLCGIYERRVDTSFDCYNDSAFFESIAYIYENLDKKLQIEDLTKIAHLSRTAYFRRFKQIMGTTPKQFLIQQRILSAQKMLDSGTMTVYEIANAVGCYDSAHLLHMLKKKA